MNLPQHAAPYVPVGRQLRETFNEHVTIFMEDFDSHLYVCSEPGLGKTKTIKEMAQVNNILMCHFEGNVTRWLFFKKLAVFLHKIGWPGVDQIPGEDFDPKELPRVVVYCDDSNSMLTPDFIDVLKIAFEEKQSDKLVYGASLGAQYKQSEKFEQEAINHFRKKDEVGFVIPFYGQVKFIFTMNHKLADIQDVERCKAKNSSLKQQNSIMDLAALSSRLSYKELSLTKNEAWGWIADLVINEDMLKGDNGESATDEEKSEILTWLYDNWDNLSDRSVRMVDQKMWKEMRRARRRPGFNYRNQWYQLVK